MWTRREDVGGIGSLQLLSKTSSADDNREGSSMVKDESTDKYEIPPDSKFLEEYIFFKANDHVAHAQSQRNFVQLRQQEVKDTRDLDHSDQMFVFCCCRQMFLFLF
jgi:hypothetical protein